MQPILERASEVLTPVDLAQVDPFLAQVDMTELYELNDSRAVDKIRVLIYLMKVQPIEPITGSA